MTESLDDNYARGGFHKTLEWGRRPAVLVIDMAEAYFACNSPLYAGVEDARDASVELINVAREAGVMVIYTGVRYLAGGANGGIFYRKIPALSVFDAGSPLGDFAKGIVSRASELVIWKQYPSAFFGTSLAATLCRSVSIRWWSLA